MTIVSRETFFSVARHCLTALGAVAVNQGFISGDLVEPLAGIAMIIFASAWSAAEKCCGKKDA